MEFDVAMQDIPTVPSVQGPIVRQPSQESVTTSATVTSSEGGDSPPKKADEKLLLKLHTKKTQRFPDRRPPSPSHQSQQSPENKPPRQVQEAWVTTAPGATAAAKMSPSPTKRPHGFKPAAVLGEPIPPPPPPSQDLPSPTKPFKPMKVLADSRPSPQRPRRLQSLWSAAFKPSKVLPGVLPTTPVETPERKPNTKTTTASEEETDMGEQP